MLLKLCHTAQFKFAALSEGRCGGWSFGWLLNNMADGETSFGLLIQLSNLSLSLSPQFVTTEAWLRQSLYASAAS